MKEGRKVVLLHGYSRRNSGDGLLVDLSTALLREALGDDVSVTLVAADPDSFPDYGQVSGAPVIADRGAGRLAAAAAALVRWPTEKSRHLTRLLAAADLVVGVGGGYLRARTGAEAFRLELGHMVQMRAMAASGRPAVYLPQSIGPVLAGSAVASGFFEARLIGLLGACTSVFVRDDRSLALLAGNRNTKRAPDLAVLEFGRHRDEVMSRAAQRTPQVSHVAIVLREAPGWSSVQRKRYVASTRALIALLESRCRVSFAVQSTGRGNDDAAYYRREGIEGDLPTLRHVLQEDTPDVVVSVRLHGALESILHGVPAFHLSYERKGFGAYEDLGIEDWVANAADFDAHAVVARILGTDAVRSFWTSTGRGMGRIRAGRAAIVAALREAAGVCTESS
ncbi:polysaccharide pyruvyl transferase family protein [Paraburkholderia sartisoli]|uniref:Polysaccharide pyruvyl transferase family protein WcaK n=1 Tax=Paraburkholderia sartisoli TaxID=83784 RepID=A0A1H4HSZ3_9BURK|nr:polysaccharide pyruvyl transferase family protein [Paraburkholderia sartisoli]SEB24947.1 Polysaccharide pyruvyl transferase family protein WcaK [Paraburkholderia sartisoli]